MKGIYLIPDRANIEESLVLAKENLAGFEYNDFFLPVVLDDKEKQQEIINFYAKVRTDFSKDTMHGAFLDVTVHSTDRRIKEVSELRIRQSLDIAKEMGLRGSVFHTNRIYGFRDNTYLKNWEEANYRFFATVCEEYPMQQIFMENMFDEAPDVLLGLAERMKGYENFGICLDYAHGAISDTSATGWVRLLAPYIKHMHINDNDFANDLHLPVGAGELNWEQFSKEVIGYGIDATVLIEVSGVEKQKLSLTYMKERGIYPLGGIRWD